MFNLKKSKLLAAGVGVSFISGVYSCAQPVFGMKSDIVFDTSSSTVRDSSDSNSKFLFYAVAMTATIFGLSTVIKLVCYIHGVYDRISELEEQARQYKNKIDELDSQANKGELALQAELYEEKIDALKKEKNEIVKLKENEAKKNKLTIKGLNKEIEDKDVLLKNEELQNRTYKLAGRTSKEKISRLEKQIEDDAKKVNELELLVNEYKGKITELEKAEKAKEKEMSELIKKYELKIKDSLRKVRKKSDSVKIKLQATIGKNVKEINELNEELKDYSAKLNFGKFAFKLFLEKGTEVLESKNDEINELESQVDVSNNLLYEKEAELSLRLSRKESEIEKLLNEQKKDAATIEMFVNKQKQDALTIDFLKSQVTSADLYAKKCEQDLQKTVEGFQNFTKDLFTTAKNSK